MGRALHLATALLNLAAWRLQQLAPPDARDAIVEDYQRACLRVWAGQERDIRGGIQNLDDYLRLVEDKTACGFAFIAAAGARLVTDDPAVVAACRACGHHVGMMLQLLDDLEACWFPDGPSDLAQGKLTFPIWFALAREHEQRDELHRLVAQPQRDEPRIREILDGLDMRRYLVWAALEERDRAVTALAACPEPAGRAILQRYLDDSFRDVAELMTRPAR
jgi:geranylgeranyl pyrophosphate synthase